MLHVKFHYLLFSLKKTNQRLASLRQEQVNKYWFVEHEICSCCVCWWLQGKMVLTLLMFTTDYGFRHWLVSPLTHSSSS